MRHEAYTLTARLVLGISLCSNVLIGDMKSTVILTAHLILNYKLRVRLILTKSSGCPLEAAMIYK